MIVDMSKIRLIGMRIEKDYILNSLARSGVVEIVTKDYETVEEFGGTVLGQKANLTNNNLEILTDVLKNLKVDFDSVDEIDFDAFLSISQRETEMDVLVGSIDELKSRDKEIEENLARFRQTQIILSTFGGFDGDLSEYVSTQNVEVYFGSVPSENVLNLKNALLDVNSIEHRIDEAYAKLHKCQNVAVLVCVKKADKAEVSEILSANGFGVLPTYLDSDFKTLTQKYNDEIEKLKSEQIQNKNSWKELATSLKNIRIYADYLNFCCQKETASNCDLNYTNLTFSLTGFVPTNALTVVEKELASARENANVALWYDFVQTAEDDYVPTLTSNRAVVKDFEFVTNLYSVPKYKEVDPNTVMSIFFSIFFGFIMADIGYGAILALICIPLGLKMKRYNGARSLVLVIGYGGIFALIWGLLFGGLFGVNLGFGVLPDAGRHPETLLVYCLAVGIFQLLAGFIVKAVGLIRKGAVLDAVLDGFVWAVFSAGVLLIMPAISISMFSADVGFVPPKELLYAGFGVAGGALAVAVVTAGRKEKLFGKFSKGFGAAYGVINYLSDVLSYARLFGLMLSGSLVANVVTEQSMILLNKGGVLAAVAVLILVIGHVFNLAISVLGAYIHDSRLQYIEFFSRFYEGEGRLFTPLGRRMNHIVIS